METDPKNAPEARRPRPATCFEKATLFDTLADGWEKVRANGGAAGGDGMGIARFAERAHQHLSRLSHTLRQGTYRPGPSRRVLVPKRSGGHRPLDIPCVIDRVAQSAVALTIGPVLDRELEESSFAYRPNRSVAHAIARICALRRDGYRHVVEGDILRYFERIPHQPLLALLDRHLQDPRLVDLIALWLEQHDRAGLGVPQGSPLSPLLANLHLDAVDEAIEERGVRLVRFADDFIILCRTEALARSSLERMRELLAAQGLELHPDKTRIVSFDQGFRFLGHTLVRSMVWQEVEGADTPSEEDLASLTVEAPAEAAPEDADEDQAPSPGRWAVRERVLYLVEPGRRLGAEGLHFAVREEDVPVLDLPAGRVDRIEIGPGVEIDVEALDLAAAHHAEVARVDGRGETLGRWIGPGPGRARLHLAQARTLLDEARRAELARCLVTGRIFNQRALLKRLDRSRKDPELGPVLVRLGRIHRFVARKAGPPEAAMAREGEAAALYWPALARLLGLDWAWSGKRRRRAGHDPFNCVLDLFAGMLIRSCAAALDRAGLHTGFGLLHAMQDEEQPLAFDLAEEFRAPLAEACAVSAFARRALREEHFEAAPMGLRLTREGWKASIRLFESWLQRPIRDPVSGDAMLWRGLIDLQARRLGEAATGPAAYRPYAMDY